MFNQKITFGKIQLNVKKDQPNDAAKPIDAAETSGIYLNFRSGFVLILMKLNHKYSIIGFGTFGKQQTSTPIDAEDLNTEDLESKRVQEIMGISEFGRKAKTFDITVRF